MEKQEIDKMFEDWLLSKKEMRELILLRGGNKVLRASFNEVKFVADSSLKLEFYLCGYETAILYADMIESFEYLFKHKQLCFFLK